jgi:hypothetical protein
MATQSTASRSMKPVFGILAEAIVFLGMLSPISWGAINWSTGPTLQKRLDESVDIVLSENPLRNALENLARNKKVAVLIDRRIDPGQKLEISINQTPLKDAMTSIAKKYGLDFSMIGPVAYFSPPGAAQRARALVALRQEDVRRLAPAVMKKYLQTKTMAWDDFATPRNLLEKLGVQNGFEIAGLEQIPHDLWAAADLPPLGIIERITLIAGQYDLTFAISADGNRITLLPVAEKIEHRERMATPNRPAERSTTKSVPDDISLKRFTLKVVEKPIGPLLKQLAIQLKLELKMDDQALEQAGFSLQQRVSFSVNNATVDELLRAALKQTRLKFVRRGNVVQIDPSGE